MPKSTIPYSGTPGGYPGTGPAVPPPGSYGNGGIPGALNNQSLPPQQQQQLGYPNQQINQSFPGNPNAEISNNMYPNLGPSMTSSPTAPFPDASTTAGNNYPPYCGNQSAMPPMTNDPYQQLMKTNTTIPPPGMMDPHSMNPNYPNAQGYPQPGTPQGSFNQGVGPNPYPPVPGGPQPQPAYSTNPQQQYPMTGGQQQMGWNLQN